MFLIIGNKLNNCRGRCRQRPLQGGRLKSPLQQNINKYVKIGLKINLFLFFEQLIKKMLKRY